MDNKQPPPKPLKGGMKTLNDALECIATEPANYGSKLCSNARKVQGFLPLVEKMNGMPELLDALIKEIVYEKSR